MIWPRGRGWKKWTLAGIDSSEGHSTPSTSSLVPWAFRVSLGDPAHRASFPCSPDLD